MYRFDGVLLPRDGGAAGWICAQARLVDTASGASRLLRHVRSQQYLLPCA
ncbi:MAG: hypothetical protein M3R09_06845 [Actinomycetota bacterium]|nr:hypothetical protein [Euzebyaceae bacterium]MDQ3029738.1 hypothetical protein [Actinomycetota bacterium]